MSIQIGTEVHERFYKGFSLSDAPNGLNVAELLYVPNVKYQLVSLRAQRDWQKLVVIFLLFDYKSEIHKREKSEEDESGRTTAFGFRNSSLCRSSSNILSFAEVSYWGSCSAGS